jgi:putative nucleotidyltransferase with HDIG domain
MASTFFFGQPCDSTEPLAAAQHLGLDIIKALAISTSMFTPRPTAPGLESLWGHSLSTAARAKTVAQTLGMDEKTARQSFVAGLLHDVGEVVFETRLNSEYRTVRDIMHTKNLPLAEAEREVLGASHEEVGAYLMGLWGLPDPVISAIAYHHRPSKCPLPTAVSVLTAVHVGNAIACHLEGDEPGSSELDPAYLTSLGLPCTMEDWIAKTSCDQGDKAC